LDRRCVHPARAKRTKKIKKREGERKSRWKVKTSYPSHRNYIYCVALLGRGSQPVPELYLYILYIIFFSFKEGERKGIGNYKRAAQIQTPVSLLLVIIAGQRPNWYQ